MNSLQDLDDNLDLQTELASSLQSEFKSFLTDNLTWLNEATTFHLISSHGRIPQLLFYAGLVKDYERVLTHYMQQGQWETALDTLREVCAQSRVAPTSGRVSLGATVRVSQAPDEQAEELYYKLSPVRAAKRVVAMWPHVQHPQRLRLAGVLSRRSN